MRSTIWRPSLIVVGVVAAVACSDSTPPATATNPPAAGPAVELTSPGDSIHIGTCTRLKATIRDAQGNVTTAVHAIWSSADTTILVVDREGLVCMATGARAGFYPVDITASALGATAHHTVVLTPDVKAVRFTAASNLLALGLVDTDSVTVILHGDTALKNPPLRIWSSNPAVVSVTPSGVVTAKALGTVSLYASLLGFTDSLIVQAIAAYHVAEIPSIETSATVVALNDNGVLIAHDDGAAFPWQRYDQQTGVTQPLSACPKFYSLNNRGMMFCSSVVGGQMRFGLSDGTTLVDVGDLDLGSRKLADAAINDSGAIAFIAKDSLNPASCGGCVRVRRPDGSISVLPDPPIQPDLVLRFDNANDVTVVVENGAMRLANGASVWTGGGYTTTYHGWIRHVGGVAVDGSMAGFSLYDDVYSECATWSPGNGDASDVQAICGASAASLNDAGEVVGTWDLVRGRMPSGLLWRPRDGVVARLENLTLQTAWSLGPALRINNHGVIVAKAMRRIDGDSVMVLVIPPGR